MADKRTVSEFYTDLAHDLIEEEEDLAHLRKPPITIIYLESTHKKKSGGRKVLGQCEKVQEKNKWGIPADFTITIFQPNVEDLTVDQLKILLFHELLHIGRDFESVEPHDLQDFSYIVNRFGADWAKPKETKSKEAKNEN